MKRVILLFTFFCSIFLSNFNFGQTSWSLKKCINHALENSIAVKQSTLQVENAELTHESNKFSRLPSLNASSSFGIQFGKSIDPTTNTFELKNTGYNTIGLSAGATLYNGGRINNSIKQSKYTMKAAQSDERQVKNDIALQVASAYLGILMSEEQLENAKQRLTLTQKQLEKTLKMIKVGTLPENDKLDILSKIAMDEQTIVNRENDVERNYFAMKQLLLLDPDFDFIIEKPKENEQIDVQKMPSFKSLFQRATQNQAFIEAGNLRIKAAELGVKIAKSQGLPSLSIFGNIDTRFSTLGKYNDGSQLLRIPQKVFINGQESVIETEREFPIFKDSPYGRQINDNIGESIGLSLRIPIFNANRTKISVAKAKLNVQQIKLANEQKLQSLKSDVLRAISDVKAARKSFEATQKTVDAAKMSYLNTEKKYNLGAANIFELTTAQNNFEQAKINLTISKYTYLFKQKVLDYYQGKIIQ